MENLFEGINWLAVLVGGLAYFALGALWYSPLLFVKRWMKDLNINPDDPKNKEGVLLIFGGSFVLMLIASIAIAILANRLNLNVWMSGVKLGAFVGCCFASTGIGINYLYEKKPLSLYLINAGYQVLGCVIAGIIICTWK